MSISRSLLFSMPLIVVDTLGVDSDHLVHRYFRGNYLILLFCSILVGLAWRRAGLWSVIILSCAAMLANDSVARGLK